MALHFPPAEDVPLANAPLIEVVCQVRFPPILSIARNQPIEFQEAIRHRFPELQEEQNLNFRLSSGGAVLGNNTEDSGRTFHFRTSDGESLASLAVDAYALSTSGYRSWDTFADDLVLIHDAAKSVYRIPYAKRVGLRYINQIAAGSNSPESLDELMGVFRPELVAMVATSAWDRPEEMVSQVLLNGDGGEMIIRVGFRAAEDQPATMLLDFDFYEEGNVPVDSLITHCHRYHDVIYRAFRWAVRSEALHRFSPLTPADRG